MSFADGISIRAALSSLSAEGIVDAASPYTLISPLPLKRQALLDAVAHAPPAVQFSIRNVAANEAMHHKEHRHEVDNNFPDPPSLSNVEDAVYEFQQRLTKGYLSTSVCMICGRRLQNRETEFLTVAESIHAQLLAPLQPHNAHNLFCGMLLHKPAVTEFRLNEADGVACLQCKHALDDGKLPPMALSNGMWVGDLPIELMHLTLAEKVVIARCHRVGFSISNTIAHFPLLPNECIDTYISSNVPPIPATLSHLFKVVSNSDGALTPEFSYEVISVRREVIENALVWLRDHNRFYRDVVIDNRTLLLYPLSGVPAEFNPVPALPNDSPSSLSPNVHTLEKRSIEIQQPYELVIGNPADLNFNRAAMTFFDLFPYGEGYSTNDRVYNCPFRDRAKYALQYDDGRFRTPHFVCETFWDVQEVEAGLSFEKYGMADDLSGDTIMLEDVENALEEALQDHRISDEGICAAMGAAAWVETNTLGSLSHRRRLGRCLGATILSQGPPSIFLAIDPMDRLYPVSRVLAGLDIDVDSVDQSYAEASEVLLRKVSDDFQSSTLFHQLSTNLLRDLLGIQSLRGHVVSSVGVLGKLSGYVAGVTTSDDGALELFIFLWLDGSCTAKDMIDNLRTVEFRQRIIDYVDSVLSSDITGDETARVRSQAYQLQVHKCSDGNSCVHARKAIANTTWVDEDSFYGLGQLSPYVTPWLPALMEVCPTYHQFEFLTNGPGTIERTASLLHSATMNFTQRCFTLPSTLDLLRSVLLSKEGLCADTDKGLVLSLSNFVNRNTRVDTRLKIMYLMGWGVCRSSRLPVTLYWDGIVEALRLFDGSLGESNKTVSNCKRRYIRYKSTALGLSQVHEYSSRSARFHHMNLITFMETTYVLNLSTDSYDNAYRTGPFIPRRVTRPTGVGVALDITGKIIGLGDKGGIIEREIFSASMLVLFKPWTSLESIKGISVSWTDAYTAFKEIAPNATKVALNNLSFARMSVVH